MSEPLEIVASFPFPPKEFYDHLSEEEILNMRPPVFDVETEKLVIFGSDQVNSIKCNISAFIKDDGLELEN